MRKFVVALAVAAVMLFFASVGAFAQLIIL